MIFDFESSHFRLGEKEVEVERIATLSGRDPDRTRARVGFEKVFRTEESQIEFFGSFLSEKLTVHAGETIILVNQSSNASIPGLGPQLLAYMPQSQDVNLIEVSDGCTGFVRALILADSLLAAGLTRGVSVVCGEVYSPFISAGSSSAPIFSDAVSITRLLPGHGFRVRGVAVKNSFEDSRLISLQQFEDKREFVMEGPSVLGWVLKNARDVAEALKVENPHLSFPPDMWFVHQASRIVVEGVGSALGIQQDGLFWSSQFGNTSSASIAIGMMKVPKLVRKSKSIGLLAFGIGLTCLGALLEAEH